MCLMTDDSSLHETIIFLNAIPSEALTHVRVIVHDIIHLIGLPLLVLCQLMSRIKSRILQLTIREFKCHLRPASSSITDTVKGFHS